MDVEPLPPLVDLEDDQQFTDGENVYDIEMRGERSYDKCYLSVSDISKCFNYRYNIVCDTLNRSRGNFIQNTDFKKFISTITGNDCFNKNRIQYYFTYEGVVKYLYLSKIIQNNNYFFLK